MMSLRDVLVDDSWTPIITSTIDDDIEFESITYYFSDSSTKISGFEEFARDFIAEVDARLDIDFREAANNNYTTIDFYNRDWTNSDGDTLGMCTWYPAGYITSETFVLGVERNRHNSYNTFVHELGHALGLGEPGFDARWDQDDTLCHTIQMILVIIEHHLRLKIGAPGIVQVLKILRGRFKYQSP